MSRNDRNYKQRIANQLAENHQIHHVFQTSDLIKEVNYVREKSGVGIRGDYLFGLDNASGTVATLDAWTATKITKELGLKGEAIPRMGPGGKQYIIFKGYPGNRNYYTGTRYLATNPKVVNMAIGKLGVQSSVIQGTSITIVLYVGINILEFFLNDESTKSRFFGQLASDMTKAVISGCMAAFAGTALAGISTVAFLPLVFAIAVGIGVGFILNEKDKQYQLTEQLIKAIEQTSNEVESGIWKFFNDLEREIEWRIENDLPI